MNMNNLSDAVDKVRNDKCRIDIIKYLKKHSDRNTNQIYLCNKYATFMECIGEITEKNIPEFSNYKELHHLKTYFFIQSMCIKSDEFVKYTAYLDRIEELKYLV